VFAGCWDKSIWSWSTSTRKPAKRYQAHTDFVKAVLVHVVGGKEYLISASADASIIVWNAESGEKVHTLKGHTRGILALAIDTNHADHGRSFRLLSAGSDREIRRWYIAPNGASELDPSPIIAHDTSIDAIRVDSDYEIWTASADKTAKCLTSQGEEQSRLEHPDFVRDVVVDEEGGWAITACRDEEVRVWNKATGKLHHTFSGHFEEVTALVLLSGQRAVSVSIDATVRQWSLKPRELAKAVKEAEDEQLGKLQEEEPEKKEGMMTAEEEAELAELLEDSE
jgi:WD40 repeat protein